MSIKLRLPRGTVLQSFILVALCAPLWAGESQVPVRAVGEVKEQDNTWQVSGKTATLVIGEPGLKQGRLRLEMQLAPGPRPAADIVIMPADTAKLNQNALARISLRRDKDGCTLTAVPLEFRQEKGVWTAANGANTQFVFWPNTANKALSALAASSGLEPRSWQGRWLHLRVDAGEKYISLWLEGRFLRCIERPSGVQGPLALILASEDQVRNVSVEPPDSVSRFLTIDLDTYANARMTKPLSEARPVIAGVPFALTQDRQGLLDLSRAQWPEWKQDPVSFYEQYDAGAAFLDDMRMPMLHIPAADYTAAHILAVADTDPGHTPVVTFRAGRYGFFGQVVQHDFTAVVPRAGAKGAPVTTAGPFYHVRIPMTRAFSQDIEDYFDIEITKELQLARSRPDPARFRIRPLGLPSGVRIAAVTFEKSPLQMRVSSNEAGHAFVEPQHPVFRVQLTNITTAAQRFKLTAEAVHLDGTRTSISQSGMVEADKASVIEMSIPVKKRGYHDISVTLSDGKGNVLLQRQTSFAVLPPDTREYRASSPFGTWDFYGTHFTPNDPGKLGPLYVKLGFRYGLGGNTAAEYLKYGLIPYGEPQVQGDSRNYDKLREQFPDFSVAGLIFHEASVSGRHATRVPDLFTDRPQYRFDESDQKRWDDLWKRGIDGAKVMREKYPQAHLRLGNGPAPTKEELLRRGFPAGLFDSLGNESASFGRLPESQPPDWVANNASLWMDRRMLDAYGYKDKPVTQCFEIGYPSSNPGNLTERMQADYMVRNALHSLAWDIPQVRMGTITDIGNSYYFSNWGAAGFCHAKPEINVKPVFVSYATMTSILDGAEFSRDVPLGSPSLYALEFTRPDGNTVYAMWTVRGQRPLTLTVDRVADWKQVDDQANETALKAQNGKLAVFLTSSPVYLIGKGKITGAIAGTPGYEEKPQGKVARLSSLSSLDEWQTGKESDPELETYDFMTPRRLGNFTFQPVKEFEGLQDVIKVTPQPVNYGKDTMPMYVSLNHKKGIPIPGKPTEIGLKVNGNSSWGRIIFELRDASGQKWISIGAQQGGELSAWLQDWMPKEVLAEYKAPGLADWNTDDVYGISRINYDGWRYLSFPLPGNYPGEGYPWPANSQWRWDEDGVVHYPLTLTRLVIELPEKTLHVKDFSPTPRPEIYIRDLLSCEGALRSSQ